MIFLKCKIRFIYVGFNCKRKKWGKKMSGNRQMANAILNFHFDFLTPSLICRQCNSEKLFNLENKLLSINTAVTEFLLVASRAINIRAARKKVQRKPLGRF